MSMSWLWARMCPCTGGDDQTVVVELLTVADQCPRLGVERPGPLSEMELQTESVELVRCVVVDARLVPRAGQELLDNGGRSWEVQLVSHDDHLAGVAQVPDSSAARIPASEAPTMTMVESGDGVRSSGAS